MEEHLSVFTKLLPIDEDRGDLDNSRTSEFNVIGLSVFKSTISYCYATVKVAIPR